MGNQPKSGMYGSQGSYSDGQEVYQNVQYTGQSGSQHGMHYTTIPPLGALDQSYASAGVFPTPPMHHQSAHSESSPESYHQDPYAQQDLSDLLGSLRVDERGTGKSFDSALPPVGQLG